MSLFTYGLDFLTESFINNIYRAINKALYFFCYVNYFRNLTDRALLKKYIRETK